MKTKGYEAISKALATGMKIRSYSWSVDSFVYYCKSRGVWIDSEDSVCSIDTVPTGHWEEYQKPTANEILIEKAKEELFPIRCSAWGNKQFILWDTWGLRWLDEKGNHVFTSGDLWMLGPLKPYKAPKAPKMIDWFRPIVGWDKADNAPHSSESEYFTRSKSDPHGVPNRKIIAWAKIKAPKTWDQVNDENTIVIDLGEVKV